MLNRKDGFTLPECMIAIFILSFVLIAMAAFIATEIKANLQSQQIQTASTLMEAKMEELRNTPLILLTDGNDSVQQGSITYTRSWTILSEFGNLKKINIKVDIGSTGRKISADTVRN